MAKEIQGMGRKSCVAIADVSKLAEVQEMIQTSVKELGELNTMCVQLRTDRAEADLMKRS